MILLGERLRERYRTTVCRHSAYGIYRVTRLENYPGNITVSAYYECPKCEKILAVEAMATGSVATLAEIVGKELGE